MLLVLGNWLGRSAATQRGRGRGGRDIRPGSGGGGAEAEGGTRLGAGQPGAQRLVPGDCFENCPFGERVKRQPDRPLQEAHSHACAE